MHSSIQRMDAPRRLPGGSCSPQLAPEVQDSLRGLNTSIPARGTQCTDTPASAETHSPARGPAGTPSAHDGRLPAPVGMGSLDTVRVACRQRDACGLDPGNNPNARPPGAALFTKRGKAFTQTGVGTKKAVGKCGAGNEKRRPRPSPPGGGGWGERGVGWSVRCGRRAVGGVPWAEPPADWQEDFALSRPLILNDL